VSDDTIDRLVLFGATGDLAGRYLLPALARLRAADELPAGFEVVGAAREALDDDGFRRLASERLAQHAPDVPAAARTALVAALRYRVVDLAEPSSVAAVIGDDARPVAAYLALPPATFPMAVTSLGEVGLPAGSRIVLEKPFGEDLASSIALNELIARVAGEDAVFRVDHVLGLATLHNLLGARLANRVLEPLWNSTHIEQIDILWDETLALEGRAGYYDHTGALEDVIQNHLLQILCLIAMEPPATLSADDLRDRKVEVLRSVRVPSPDHAVRRSTRARYTAGTLAPPPEGAGTPVPAYVDEEGVDPARETETFAEIVLELDSPRWSGTPFLLRTGKALHHRHKGVVVRFREAPSPPFGPDTPEPPPNELYIGLDGPETVTLHLTGSAPGPPPRLAPLVLTAELPANELPAYSHVLLHVLRGDNTLSIRGDEAELAWRIVTPFIEAWADGRVPLQDYPAGSTGPPEGLEHRRSADGVIPG
jgi:glucose-6-phosphate 1-dehydrogenase